MKSIYKAVAEDKLPGSIEREKKAHASRRYNR